MDHRAEFQSFHRSQLPDKRLKVVENDLINYFID